MRLARHVSPALVATLVLTRCESPPPANETSPPAVTELGPSATLRFPAHETSYGSLVNALVRIQNGGVQPILVRSVELPGQLPDAVCWFGRRRGDLKLERHRRQFVWRFRSYGWTPGVFAAGLLYPGETMEFERAFRVREPSQEIEVLYQEVGSDETGGELLLPDAKATPPQRRHYEARFVPATVSIRSTFQRHAPRPDLVERLVIVPEFGAWPTHTRRSVERVIPFDAETRAQVLESLGYPGAELSRWERGGVWLVRRIEDRELLLFFDGGGDVETFPDIGFEVFDLADLCARKRTHLWLETPETTEGELEPLDPERLLEVLRTARDRGWRVEIDVLDPDTPERTPYLALR